MDYERMHHDDIDRRRYDVARRDAPPARRVVICSTPRSGSFLLCRQMINAGIGVPTEYFRFRTHLRLAERYEVRADDHVGYIEALEAHRTTANGVFAAKVQWAQLKQHADVRERLIARADLVIHLFRRDLIAQAVSWQVSLATGFWSFDRTPGPRAPEISLDRPDQTLKLAHGLVEQDRRWADLLNTLGRPVLRVPYESYVREQPEFITRIASGLGLSADAWRMPPPEGRDNRLPDEVEAARARLLEQARAAYAPASP